MAGFVVLCGANIVGNIISAEKRCNYPGQSRVTWLVDYERTSNLQLYPYHFSNYISKGGSFAPNEPPLRTGLMRVPKLTAYNIIPLDISLAAEIFTRTIFKDLMESFCHVDNIMLYLSIEVTNDDRLGNVLRRLHVRGRTNI